MYEKSLFVRPGHMLCWGMRLIKDYVAPGPHRRKNLDCQVDCLITVGKQCILPLVFYNIMSG